MTDRELKRLEFAKKSVWKEPIIQIDKKAIVHRSSAIGVSGFGYARDSDGSLVKINHAGGVRIEANVEVRAFCTIDRATNEGVFTIVGEGSAIDHHCHVAHNVKIGKHNTLANGCVIEGSCEVGDFNTFGANVVVQRKVKIGNNCIFGSGSVVTKDVADNSIMVGNPAKLLRMK